MTQLVYSEQELYADHDYARPHVEDGRRLHGGFDADGNYLPPRSALRYPAIRAWSQALQARGGALFEADASLLSGPRLPTEAQQRLLLRNGVGQTFWNNLTITGKIEARGKVLAEMAFPDLQEVIVEDISNMALGHLNKGLLATHGLDEGGQPELGIGGHDVMWFVARDLAFGRDAYPDVDPPESIGRPEAGRRWMPMLPQPIEGMLSFLMNLLMIEFRAEIGFTTTQAILRSPDVFTGRRAEAERAAEIVERIRTDELIHVESLRLYLGELCELTLRTVDGGRIAGRDVIEPFWAGLVQWATVEQPQLAAQQQFATLRPLIEAQPDGAALLEEFIALGTLPRERLLAA